MRSSEREIQGVKLPAGGCVCLSLAGEAVSD